jgi:predicted Ser/Thr protein kinase
MLFDFKVERVIGEGGFSVVYLALDQSLQRRIAIKEYLPRDVAYRRDDGTVCARSAKHQEAFEAGREGFLEEARLLAKFEHPALIRVIRYWEANGTAYIATFYYPGVTLRELLKKDRSSVSESSLKALLGPLLDAVEMLHAKQCFHRDIAPDNIIVQPNGRPVLLDFGAARRIIGDMTHALTAVIKPGYAPLEQYADEGGLVQGPWTDVYGFAALLYWAIVGSPPAASVARAIKDSLVPLERDPPAGYGVGFLRAIDRGLSVRPEDRPQSIAEFRDELGLNSEQDWERTILIGRTAGIDTPARPADARSASRQLLAAPGGRAGAAAMSELADASAARIARGWRMAAFAAGCAALLAITVAALVAFRTGEADDTRLATGGAPQDVAATVKADAQVEENATPALPTVAAPTVRPVAPAPIPTPDRPSGRAAPASSTSASSEPPAPAPSPIATAARDPWQPLAPAVAGAARTASKGDPPPSGQGTKEPTKLAKAKSPMDASPAGKTTGPGGQIPDRISKAPDAGTRTPGTTTAIAEPASAKALFELAQSYAKESGAQENAAAVQWFRKSAEQGYAPAQSQLGKIYFNGFGGVQKDPREAANWYLKAATQGDASAQMSLGFMYANGIGVLKDDAAAVGWYRKSAEQGNALAQNYLGDMLATGRGGVRDSTEAAQWYRKAAEAGNSFAQNSLGRLYETGVGVVSSTTEARKWYSLAAAKGNGEAAQRLKILDQAAAK